MTKTLSLAQKFRMPRLVTRAAMSMSLLLMSFGALAKTASPSTVGSLKNASALTVPELNEWRDMDYSASSIKTPKKVAYGLVKPYNQAKVQYLIDLVLNETKYDQEFEQASMATGIPAIYLKIVAAAESGLKSNAKSSTGPVGVMQFTRATGRSAGLAIGNGVDERLDPTKSIHAGALYTAYNLQRSKGHLFTTRENGKTVYGAFARYYGIVKNGDWKQYEANLKAVFDYFNLPHDMDMDNILMVQNDWKAKKLRAVDAEQFSETLVAQKEEKHRFDQYREDVLPLDIPDQLFDQRLDKMRDDFLKQQSEAYVIVRDNITVPTHHHADMAIENAVNKMVANQNDVTAAKTDKNTVLRSIKAASVSITAHSFGPPISDPDNAIVGIKTTIPSYDVDTALGRMIKQRKMANLVQTWNIAAQFNDNTKMSANMWAEKPEYAADNLVKPKYYA